MRTNFLVDHYYASFHAELTRFLAGNRHCRIVWDGKEDEKSAVIVADYSSNGTFVGFDASFFLVTRVTYEPFSS